MYSIEMQSFRCQSIWLMDLPLFPMMYLLNQTVPPATKQPNEKGTTQRKTHIWWEDLSFTLCTSCSFLVQINRESRKESNTLIQYDGTVLSFWNYQPVLIKSDYIINTRSSALTILKARMIHDCDWSGDGELSSGRGELFGVDTDELWNFISFGGSGEPEDTLLKIEVIVSVPFSVNTFCGAWAREGEREIVRVIVRHLTFDCMLCLRARVCLQRFSVRLCVCVWRIPE